MFPYWASVGGLFWPTTFACLAIKSLTEGEIGQCSPWGPVDWQVKHGWRGTYISVIAHTSCWFLISSSSILLVRVDNLAFSSTSSASEYMPPLWFTGGLCLSVSLGFCSSQALEVSTTSLRKSMASSGFFLRKSPPHIVSNSCFMAGDILS